MPGGALFTLYAQGHLLTKTALIITNPFVFNSTVKNLPAMQETWVLSPGQEDPPEKGMATHSSILTLKTP